jgi:gluconokinase
LFVVDRGSFIFYNAIMSLLILFGHPGSGKTYVGKVIRDAFDYHFFDGDDDLSQEMREAIASKTVFTDQMRDSFFAQLNKRIGDLKKTHDNLVVSQTFIKEKYREALLRRFPEAKFILVKTDADLREARILQRKEYPLDLEYSKKMVVNFDTPQIVHNIIKNNEEGKAGIIKQIKPIL